MYTFVHIIRSKYLDTKAEVNTFGHYSWKYRLLQQEITCLQKQYLLAVCVCECVCASVLSGFEDECFQAPLNRCQLECALRWKTACVWQTCVSHQSTHPNTRSTALYECVCVRVLGVSHIFRVVERLILHIILLKMCNHRTDTNTIQQFTLADI